MFRLRFYSKPRTIVSRNKIITIPKANHSDNMMLSDMLLSFSFIYCSLNYFFYKRFNDK